jgi:uncharacterized SAM-binding protein YcdF (DUF218 family)
LTVSDAFPAASDTASRPRFRKTKRALVCFLLLAALAAAVWFTRVPLLRGAAELWIVSDVVGPADAVVIFGGGLEVRPFAAAEYYKNGLTKKILVANVGLDKAEMLGVLPSHTALNRSVLLKLGVPETAIEIFGPGMSNTYQEAVALREWALRTHARSVIVPTQAFSSRRVRWMVERELSGTGLQVKVIALDDTEYGLSDWWKDDKAIIEFQNEVIKYVFYRFKY